MYTYMYRRIQTHACVSHIRQLGHVCITVTPPEKMSGVSISFLYCWYHNTNTATTSTTTTAAAAASAACFAAAATASATASVIATAIGTVSCCITHDYLVFSSRRTWILDCLTARASSLAAMGMPPQSPGAGGLLHMLVVFGV